MFAEVCIIGSNGFLAKEVIRFFNKKGKLIDGFSRKKNEELNDFFLFDHPAVLIDFSKLLRYKIIIYAAGGGVQHNSNQSTNDIYFLNSHLPIEIVIFLKERRWNGKFITFGSYFEIGFNSLNKLFTENELILSENLVPNDYCISKRLLTRFLYRLNTDFLFYHLILPNIYGKGENDNRLLPYLVTCLKNNLKVNLTSGTQIRQYLHVSDVSECLYNICNNDFPKGIYNITQEMPLEIRDLVSLVYKKAGKEIDPYIFGKNSRIDNTMHILLLSSCKARELINFSPKISIEEGISSYF